MILNQSWKVVYYIKSSGKIPVREILNSTKPQIKSKAFRIFQYLEEYGLQSVIPHIKKLSGTPLWEIRMLGGDNVRILFVTQVNKQII